MTFDAALAFVRDRLRNAPPDFILRGMVEETDCSDAALARLVEDAQAHEDLVELLTPILSPVPMRRQRTPRAVVNPDAQVILREAEVHRRTGLSRTTRWRLEREGKFPQRVRLSECTVGWLETEVDAWVQERLTGR